MSQPEFLNLIIRASAGTGKTFQLSNRYLGLLSCGVTGEQILASTFTRKAAGEILDRVVLRLAEAASDSAQSQQLADFVGDQTLSRERCLVLLKTLMQQLHRLRVGTLDSFFGQIARSFSLDLGLPPGWRIVEELDDAALRSEAIETVLQREDPQDLRTLLNLLTKGEAVRGVSQLVRNTVDSLYALFQETDREAWFNLPRHKGLKENELADALEDLRTVELAEKRMTKARDEDYTRALDGRWQEFIDKGLAKKVVDESCQFYRKPIPEFAVAVYRRLVEHARAELIGRVAL